MANAATNSCLYKAKVMHHRLAPKVHRFHYEVFMFYLDLDEIDSLSKRLKFMSRNKFNLFNFRDKDHLQLPREKPDASKKHSPAYNRVPAKQWRDYRQWAHYGAH